MALINKIAAQTYRTFCRSVGASEQFNENLSVLRDLMRRLTRHDVNLSDALVCDTTPFDPDSGLAPVTFIDLWNDEHFSMSIFILKPGTRLPLHDHPGMHGLIQVVHGCMNVVSYSLQKRKSVDGSHSEPVCNGENYSVRKGDVFTAHRISAAVGDMVDINSEPIMLTPVDGNIHEIRTANSTAAFFDILAPPYDERRRGPRQCHYYKELPASKSSTDLLSANAQQKTLVCIPTPLDYWTDYATYDGPDINPFDYTVTA